MNIRKNNFCKMLTILFLYQCVRYVRTHWFPLAVFCLACFRESWLRVRSTPQLARMRHITAHGLWRHVDSWHVLTEPSWCWLISSFFLFRCKIQIAKQQKYFFDKLSTQFNIHVLFNVACVKRLNPFRQARKMKSSSWIWIFKCSLQKLKNFVPYCY